MALQSIHDLLDDLLARLKGEGFPSPLFKGIMDVADQRFALRKLKWPEYGVVVTHDDGGVNIIVGFKHSGDKSVVPCDSGDTMWETLRGLLDPCDALERWCLCYDCPVPQYKTSEKAGDMWRCTAYLSKPNEKATATCCVGVTAEDARKRCAHAMLSIATK